MPAIIKHSVPHIIIAMFVAPITLGLFNWAGAEFLTNRDVKLQMPELEKDIQIIISNQSRFEMKQDEVLQNVWVNAKDIAVLKADCKNMKKGI